MAETIELTSELRQKFDKKRKDTLIENITDEELKNHREKTHEINKKKEVRSALGYGPLAFTDLGNAAGYIHEYGFGLQYCQLWNSWLWWCDTHWQRDENQVVPARVKKFIRGLYNTAFVLQDNKLSQHAFRSSSRNKMEALLSLARSETGIPMKPQEFDTHKYLLNLENGTYDLKEGKLRGHRWSDYITKSCRIAFNEYAECPLWLKFLDRIMAGDKDMITFLQLMVGYALTGDISEQALFILFGSGSNGKSTFIETIAALLGDYAVNTPVETLLVKRSEGIPNDIARLKGGRLVYAVEAEQNRRLAESLVKQLTGGDSVTARFLHAEFFSFNPEFKIFLATNHRPIIRGADHAIWRRIHLIPFSIKIPEADQDKYLKEKLKKELPGILNWALEGYAVWQQNGLCYPEKVQNATKEYKSKMDILADFLSDCCEINVSDETKSSAIYARYRQWAEDNGEKVMSQKKFSMLLEERDFQKERNMTAVFWIGIRLRG